MMKLPILVAAVSLAFAAGCDRNTTRAPSPKADSTSSAPSAASGATTSSGTTSSSAAKPSTEDKRNGGNPQQGQVDPAHANQHRDFQQNGDQAGPKSPDTAPTMKN
jgi:hypothetical protein